MKRCTVCGTNKSFDEFYNHKSCKDGKLSQCRHCTMQRTNAYRRNNPHKNKKYHADWRKKNPERARQINLNSRLRSSYGIDELGYLTLLFKQNYRCAICRTDKVGAYKRFHIDHCHVSGEVRGLLCHHCNLLLGNAKDSVGTLAAAITYLSANNER